MNYRRLGRTDLRISELAFGCGRSGGILIDADDRTKLGAVRLALDCGINWFDTAPQYGQGKSEEALGWLLREVKATPCVSTKVMIGPDDLGDIAGSVERSLHESLRRLRRESVDLLQLHNRIAPHAGSRAVTADHVLGRGGVADGMERLRDQGLIAFMGLTALGDRRETARVIDSGRFDSAQVYYNMINPSAARDAMPPRWSGFDSTGIVAACRAQDMGVMAIRVFAAGYLAAPERTGRESILTADTDPESEARMAEAAFTDLGDAYGGRAQTAVRFALSNAEVSTAIIGLAAPSHLSDASAAADRGPLPEDAMQRLERLYERGFAA